VIRSVGVGMRGAKARITEKAKATKMLEDDPGSTSGQMMDPR